MNLPMYRITITRIIANPAFDPEVEKAKEARGRLYNNYEVAVQPTIEDKALTVDLTETEFQAVKKAALECM